MTPQAYLAGSKIPLTQAQRAMAELVLVLFTAEGFSPQVAMGAVANAYAESKFDPRAVAGFDPWSGDHVPGTAVNSKGVRITENSVGLFQLNKAGGGYGMTDDQRRDPRLNTARIISELRAAERTHGPVVTGAATGAQAARTFCVYVERPSNASEEAEVRAGYAVNLFGDLATSKNPPKIDIGTTDRITHTATKTVSAVPVLSLLPVPIAIGVGTAALGLAVWWIAREFSRRPRRRGRMPAYARAWRLT